MILKKHDLMLKLQSKIHLVSNCLISSNVVFFFLSRMIRFHLLKWSAPSPNRSKLYLFSLTCSTIQCFFSLTCSTYICQFHCLCAHWSTQSYIWRCWLPSCTATVWCATNAGRSPGRGAGNGARGSRGGRGTIFLKVFNDSSFISPSGIKYCWPMVSRITMVPNVKMLISHQRRRMQRCKVKLIEDVCNQLFDV